MTDTVGFIGLGLMGGAIARRYLESGKRTIVYDLSPALTEKLTALGAEPATSPRDVADRAQIIIACLPSPAASHDVALGERGIHAGTAVHTYIETSTMGLSACKAIATELRKKNIDMCDAPVSGGPKATAQGKLTSMVAAAPDVWENVAPIIQTYSAKVFYVGQEPGLGQACKLVNNAMSLSTLALACETAVFGVAAGLDAKTMIDVINASSGRSAATMDKFPAAILTRSFDYGASVRTAAKDLQLFIEEASTLGMDVKGTSCMADIWHQAELAGDPERDFTSLIQQFEAPLGITVGSTGHVDSSER